MIEFNEIKINSSPPAKGTNNLKDNILLIRTANQCIEEAKNQPIPKMLFSEFWHQGELCILFADTNIGKSILSVQIADSISRGESIRGFKLEAPKQVVLYFDFEQTVKQIEKRYSYNYSNHYLFDDSLYRVELNPLCMDFTDFEKSLYLSIEHAILEYNSRVLIVDNLTYLKTTATETAKEALPLMKMLKDLKIKHDLSILALAHTPKRNLLNPITRNDLAGSKHLANFADSIFAIGESSKDKSLRYLKQIKARATEIVYDASHVIVCEISQPYNFLGYHFLDFSHEQEHLKQLNQDQESGIDEQIINLKQSSPSISNYEISKQLNINQMKVKRVLARSFANTTNSTNRC